MEFEKKIFETGQIFFFQSQNKFLTKGKKPLWKSKEKILNWQKLHLRLEKILMKDQIVFWVSKKKIGMSKSALEVKKKNSHESWKIFFRVKKKFPTKGQKRFEIRKKIILSKWQKIHLWLEKILTKSQKVLFTSKKNYEMSKRIWGRKKFKIKIKKLEVEKKNSDKRKKIFFRR